MDASSVVAIKKSQDFILKDLLGSNLESVLSLSGWISVVCKQYNYQLCSKCFKKVSIWCNQFQLDSPYLLANLKLFFLYKFNEALSSWIIKVQYGALDIQKPL